MRKTSEADIPDGLRKLHGRLEGWRGSHRGRVPIPMSLWNAAVQAAQTHGLYRTAQVLRLEYGKLKRLMTTTDKASPSPATFIELASPAAGGHECVLELEGKRGRLRLHLGRVAAADVAALSRSLWEVVS